MVEGQLQREGEVIHVIVKRCFNFSRLLQKLTSITKEDLPVKTSRSDETTSPFMEKKKIHESEIVQGKIFPEGRNFR